MRFIHLARRMYRNGGSYTYTTEKTLPLLRRRISRPETVLQHGRVRMRLLAAGGGEASGWAGLKQNGGEQFSNRLCLSLRMIVLQGSIEIFEEMGLKAQRIERVQCLMFKARILVNRGSRMT
jgi:hypothetical protein